MKKNWIFLLRGLGLVLSLVFLANCGGGGGGGESSSSSGDTTAPSAPANLTAASNLPTEIGLSWSASTDNVGVTGYKIYRDGSYLSSSAVTSYTDAGLTPSTKYSYSVSAYDAAGNESVKSNTAEATTPIRTVQFGTTANDVSYGVAVDMSGNIYLAGYTQGNLGATNQGSADIFLAKYDSSKTLQWVRQLGTPANEIATAVTTDGSGNVYIAGYTGGNLDGELNSGLSDAFLVKYDSAGNRLWTKLLGTSSDDQAWAVGADATGNVYISGYTQGNLGGANSGSSDIFLAKYDSSGTLQWVKQTGTTGRDEIYGMDLDSSGNVYIAGFTAGSLAGANAGGFDLFLAKYDSSGNTLWSKQLGTAAADFGESIAVDGNGNAYISGYTNGGLDGANRGGRDIFLAKYDASGNFLWVKQLGTANEDIGYGVTLDASGNAYVTGGTQGGLDGNTNKGDYDIFVVKYDSSGTKQWVTQIGTAAEDVGIGIAFDNGRNVAYIAGNTLGSLDGNTSAGGYDAVLLKISPSGQFQ